ncbi:polymorphic toxin-type HINT domain-containing protein, partial [Streptomyces purpureus]
NPAVRLNQSRSDSTKLGAAHNWVRERARETARQVMEAKRQITRQTRALIERAAKYNPIPHIKAAVKPLMAVGVAIVTASANLPAMVVSVASNVIVDVAQNVDAIRKAVVDSVGSVVETVKNVGWDDVWEGVKTVGNFVGEVTGFNDIKRCVTEGDMESCAWAVATVAGLALGGVGAGFVRAARAGRMVSKAAKYTDDVAKVANKIENTVDRVESAAQCVSTAAEVASLASGNSFVAGTEVVMADGTRKPIEKVEEGDEVLATDPTTGRTTKQKVTATIVGEGEKQLVRLTVDTDGPAGSATDDITATQGHPFWSPSLKKWLKAGELKPGQWLQTGSGTWVQVEAVSAWTQHAAVYNLTVDTAHTYYVAAGATSVLVHNENSRKNPLYCPLSAYTDLRRMGPGKNEGAASALWTPSGNVYFDVSRRRTDMEKMNLPLVLRRVVQQTEHHGGCAEIGCIAQALEAGEQIRGSQSLAMLRKPFDHDRYRDLLPGCGSCQQVMSRLKITDTYSGEG